jgi:hypothetical protein
LPFTKAPALPGFAEGASGAGIVEVVDVDTTFVVPSPEAVMPFGTVVVLPEFDVVAPPELFPPLPEGAVALVVGVFDTTVVEDDEGTVVAVAVAVAVVVVVVVVVAVVVVVVVVPIREPSVLTTCGVLKMKVLGIPDSVAPLPNWPYSL